MAYELRLSAAEARSAADIQTALNLLSQRGGGRLTLPAMDLTLDRGLELGSGVELVGQGEQTILRKGPGRAYPLTGYCNYGMCDVPLADATGLAVGMTVSVLDNARGGFASTFARITWIDAGWVGLDRGLESDYHADQSPRLTTAYPLIFAHRARGIAIRKLRLVGNRAASQTPMDSCRGSAIYFGQCVDCEVSNVLESDYDGDGIGFQMCRNVRLFNTRCDGNAGNGFHPGAGSTQVLFDQCAADSNVHSGFFFCVRANHVTVRDCCFSHNDIGVSVGARDCHNELLLCTLRHNRGPGLYVRPDRNPVEVYALLVDGCTFDTNGADRRAPAIDLNGDAHDLIVTRCTLRGQLGIQSSNGVHGLWLEANDESGCDVPRQLAQASLASVRPEFAAGFSTAIESDWRHLPTI